MSDPSLLIVGEMLHEPAGWDVKTPVGTRHYADAMFVAYNQVPPENAMAFVYGTNMSRPTWTRPNMVTTRDIPRDILNTVTPTAEHAIGLMMALHRNLIPASREPLADRSKFLAPKMLSRMTAGILGAGRIGNMVWRKLEPLMLATLAYDPVLFPDASLSEVLSRSEVLFLCCPSSPFGHPMGMKEFEQMPDGALIINVAQPDLLDWEAVIVAIGQGTLGGVAADVYPPYVADYWSLEPLEIRDRLLLTPHIAGSTVDARIITEKAVLDVMQDRL